MKKALLGLAMCILIVNAVEGVEETVPQVVSLAQKEVMGEVSGIGVNYISIIYKKDAEGVEYDMLLPMNVNTIEFEGVKHFKQIKSGDTVLVSYDEQTSINDETGETTVNRKARKIKFLKPAPQTLQSGE